MAEAVIVAGARTPIGKLSGALAGFTAMDLGGFAIAEALTRAGVAPDQVDYVLMGQVILAGQGQITARQAAVKGGIPMTVPANTINKVCLSGLNTIYLADQMIRAGDADIVVAGGMESMTQAPYLLPGARAGYRLGDGTLVDSMMYDGLTDAFDHIAMGLSTEQHNEKAGISRERQDAFAAASHEKAAAAAKEGRLAEEIVPVQVPQRKGDPLAGRHRRGRAAGHDGRVARRAEARLRQGRHHHRRQRVADLRRWLRGHRDVGGQGQGARRHPARPDRRLRHGGRAGQLAADPALAGHRQGGRQGRASTSATSTCSRSTRPSPPSAWPRSTTSASTRTRSTSTAAPSRSATPWACRAPGSRSPRCSSCAAAAPPRRPWRCAAAAARATPPSCARWPDPAGSPRTASLPRARRPRPARPGPAGAGPRHPTLDFV